MSANDSSQRFLADRFLARFNAVDGGPSPLSLLKDDSDGYLEAIIHRTREFSAAIDDATNAVQGTIADLIGGSFASAACQSSGVIHVADEAFRAWLMEEEPNGPHIRVRADGGAQLSLVLQNRTGRIVAVASAGKAAARSWPVSSEVHAELDAGRATHAALAFRPDGTGWTRASRALGLTPAQSRLVAALVLKGDLRAAARAVGVSYETARTTIGDAIQRSGAKRQTELVRIVLRLAGGDLREPDTVTRVFADLFGLTLRQAQLARIIASGASRAEAARLLGVSQHTVKTDLKHVHVACGATSALDLTRLSAEVDALAGLATACDIRLARAEQWAPLRLLARNWAPGRIAVSDHGPLDSFPVFILHTLTMGRELSPRFVAALQTRGLRPIVFERSGFGLTDFVQGEPIDVFVRDFEAVIDALGCERVLVVGIGMPHGAVSAAGRLPDKVMGGLLINPGPPARLDRSRRGFLGASRAIFYERPWLTEKMARLLSQRTSSEAIARLLLDSVRGSSADAAALSDPIELDVLVRACRQCAQSMRGFLAEISARGAGAQAAALADGRAWTLVFGDQDAVFDQSLSRPYWQEKLPGARVLCLPDGGRMVHLTHSTLLADLCGEQASQR
jgi:pimeloyl-ACP methyl ester carboxylesterase/DNA-binding CsgD family transcriptional regulator